MKLKSIGKKEDIFIAIDKNIEDKWFTEISFIINNYKFPTEGQENLSFLCADFEYCEIAINDESTKNYKDNYFWNISNDELIKSWNKYFNARTIEELEDEEVELFDKKFVKSMLPLDSRFFNIWTFIGYNDGENWHWKVWETINPKEILNFKISIKGLNNVLKETSSFLREEILLD